MVVSEDDEASLTIPLILDPRCDFTAKKDRGDYKAQYEKLGRLHDEASEAVFTAVQTYRDTVMVEMGKDPTLAKLFVRGRRPPTFAEITKGIADVTSDNTRLREMQRKHQNDMRKLLSSVRIYGLILAYTDTAPESEFNSKTLESVPLRLPADKEQIDTALSKFASMLHVSTESLCLDCWYEHDHPPFMTESVNTKRVRLEPVCLNCGGAGIVHKAEITFPRYMGKLFMESSNWFYEVLIGHVASKTQGVKSVFVHKKIQPYSGGNVSKGAEIDVAILTDTGKLYFVEVTKKSDANAILDDAQRKITLYRRLNLPFEKMAFVTAGAAGRYADLGADLRIFNLKHLMSLPDFLGDWIRGTQGGEREPQK